MDILLSNYGFIKNYYGLKKGLIMDKIKTNNMLSGRFRLPDNTQYIYYRNPRECCKFILERINPNHIGLIWGLQKRKLRKYKNSGYIKIAKVLFNGLFAPTFLFLDKGFYLCTILLSIIAPELLFYNITISILMGIFIYYFPNIVKLSKM